MYRDIETKEKNTGVRAGGWGDFEISVSKLQQNNTSQREREGIERERKEKRDFLNNLYSFDSY